MARFEKWKRRIRQWKAEAAGHTGYESFRAPRLAPREGAGAETYLWRDDWIRGVALRAATDPRRQEAVDNVVALADAALAGPDYSVIDKQLAPPGGDKRDYFTGGSYWWPTPGSENGAPWVFRDGHMYPGRFNDEYDLTRLDEFSNAVQMLTLAYRFNGNRAYAERAAHLLRVWFLDSQRSMRPHLKYAQIIPGRAKITGTGIIETLRFVGVIDSVGMLAESQVLSDTEVEALRGWFAHYTDWLWTSPNGVLERATNNNHGLSYDIQLMTYALFSRKDDLAREVAEAAPRRRIYAQIMGDASLPEELRRKEAFFYVAYGIGFFFDLATLAERVGVDLWRYRARGGAGIEPALRSLMRYAAGGSPWPHGGDRVPSPELYALALRGAWAYADAALARIATDYADRLPLQPIDWTVPPYTREGLLVGPRS